jgi:phosphohistidine phosphatase
VIWLLRHGDAADGSPDAERPLTDKGREQSHAAGAALKALGIELDACLTSPRVRAADTARIACEQLDGPEPQLEPKLAGGPFDAEALAAGLGDEVLLVGHEPDFSAAVHALTGAQVRMKKGGLAGIEKGELIVLLRPKELKRIAASTGAHAS